MATTQLNPLHHFCCCLLLITQQNKSYVGTYRYLHTNVLNKFAFSLHEYRCCLHTSLFGTQLRNSIDIGIHLPLYQGLPVQLTLGIKLLWVFNGIYYDKYLITKKYCISHIICSTILQ